MPNLSKEQVIAISYGVLYKNKGSTATQKFTPIAAKTLLTPGLEVQTCSITSGVATITVADTTNITPGMLVTEVNAKAGQMATNTGNFPRPGIFVYSINSATEVSVGSDAQYIDVGLKATLATGTNTVTLTEGDTSQLLPGHQITIVAGQSTGAFNATGSFVLAVTGPKTFTVKTTRIGSAVANHATAGEVLFYVGGTPLNHATSGGIDLVFGGYDVGNNAIPGMGNPVQTAYKLANSTDLIGADLVHKTGGDINNGATLGNEEKDYHYTGQLLLRKLK